MFTNLLTNSGFENDPKGAGWLLKGNGSAYVNDGFGPNAHGGVRYLTLSSPGPNAQPEYQALSSASPYFAVNPGDVIKFGGWVYKLGGDGLCRWKLELTDNNKSTPSWHDCTPSDGTLNKWVLQSGNVTVPAGKAFARFFAEIYKSSTVTSARFDDAVFSYASATVVPPLQPTSLINLNTLFVGQPVSWSTKLLPDPTIIRAVRDWDAQTNMPLPGSQHEKNLITNLTRMPNQELLLQLGTDKIGGIPDATYIAILQNLLRIQVAHPNLKAISLWNEPNASSGALGVDAVGHLASLARQQVGGKLLIIGPSTQGEHSTIETNPSASYFGQFAAKYANLVDVLDHHIYGWSGISVYNDMLKWVLALNAIAKAHNKPLWNTEGQPTGYSGRGTVKGQTATDDMAAYFKAIHDGGSQRFYWWGYDNTDMPIVLIDSARTGLTPEGISFMTLAKQYN